jgi:hypothetical protein
MGNLRNRLESLVGAIRKNKQRDVDPLRVRPVVLPFKLGDNIPSYKLPCGDLYVLWVESGPSSEEGFVDEVYVTREREKQLNNLGYSVPELAFKNVVDLSQGVLSTHADYDEFGNLAVLGLLQEDGYNPARALMSPALSDLMASGYLVGIPDRRSAMILSNSAADNKKQKVRQAIESGFENGDGVCKRLLTPEEIAVPGDWLINISEWFAEHKKK